MGMIPFLCSKPVAFLFVTSLTSTLLCGCAVSPAQANYAREIVSANTDLVTTVDAEPGNYLDPPSLYIHLKIGTREAATTVLCSAERIPYDGRDDIRFSFIDESGSVITGITDPGCS